MQKILTLIILTISLTAWDLTSAEENFNYVLIPFLKNNNEIVITQFYSSFFETYLLTKPKPNQNAVDLIIEMANFDWKDSEIEHFGDVDESRLIKSLIAVFREFEDSILNNKYESLKAELLKVVQKLVYRVIQSGKGNELEQRLITENILRTAVSQFKSALYDRPLIEKPLADTILVDIQKLYKRIVPVYTSFILFQNLPFGTFDTYLNTLLDKLGNNEMAIKPGQTEISTQTFMLLVKISAYISSKVTDPFRYMQSLALSKLLPFIKSSKTNKDLFDKLYNEIILYHYDQHTIDKTESAKFLFSTYFLPETFSHPTLGYMKFLLLKFTEEGLKLESKNEKFSRMHKFYALDILFTSLHRKFPPTEEEKLNAILPNFLNFVDEIDKLDIARFDHFRQIFFANEDLIDRYHTIFASFYEIGIAFLDSQHLKNDRTDLDYFALEFNAYIDKTHNTSRSYFNRFINDELPNQQIFNMNLKENYIAYKFILVEAFQNQLNGRKIVFNFYDDVDDKNVEEFLFTNQKYMTKVLAVKAVYLHNVGINYKMFSGVGYSEEATENSDFSPIEIATFVSLLKI